MIARVRVKSKGRLLEQLTADLLVLIGACGVLIWVWAWADGAIYQHEQKAAFEKASADTPSQQALADVLFESVSGEPPVPRIKNLFEVDSKMVGKLEVSRIGLSVMVRDGVDTRTLRRAAGRLPSSAIPGQTGNLVILAHRDTFFRPLRHIARNDVVILRTLSDTLTYRVEAINVVAPEAEHWREFDSTPRLTLITCFPFDYIGPAPQRFIVTATLVGDAKRNLPNHMNTVEPIPRGENASVPITGSVQP